MKLLSRNFGLALAGLLSLFASFGAMAAPPDFSTLTSAVDFTTVGTAILAVFASIVGVYLLWKGGKMVLSALRGA